MNLSSFFFDIKEGLKVAIAMRFWVSMVDKVIRIWNVLVALFYILTLIFAFGASFATFIVVAELGFSIEESLTTKQFIETYGPFIGAMIPFFLRVIFLGIGNALRIFARKKMSDKDKFLAFILTDGLGGGFFIQTSLNFLNDFSGLMALVGLTKASFSVDMILLQVILLAGFICFSILSYFIRSRWQQEFAL